MPDAFILIVDDDAVSRRLLSKTLADAELQSAVVSTGSEAMEWLEQHTPSVVLLDLYMPEPDGYSLLRYIRSHARLADVPVVVLTALESDDEIHRVFLCGADDYVHKPFRPAELIARIRGQMRLRDYVERLSRRERDQQIVLDLTQTLASSLDIRDILFTVTQRVAKIVQVDRCSIVLAGEPGSIGYVVASSDNEMMRDLPINLVNYPEIRQVLSTGRSLVIRDAQHHPLFDVVRQGESQIGFSSIALMPILLDGEPMGVIFLRARQMTAFSDQEMALVHTIANATAIALRNARILQSLRDETQQITFARVEAERRVQLFQRYADFFESAADGMVVIDRTGAVLFANPRAREITGFSETELMDLNLEKLLVPRERDRARRLLRGFDEGVYPRGVDVRVTTKGGEPITISVSFSSVLHEDNAILFTFRDVTQERTTAVELKQTKEFLERVIDSSVDAIVFAELNGTVLLFNRAASRIFRYAPSEVIGKMRVERLYPPGVAREIMKKIRDVNFGGYGRLEEYRVDMLNAGGDAVPVVLSAALVMENGKPIGSVGVFTDIRDKLRMEERLAVAQDELRQREKQAIVAELAGAAAHELNQPLTSVIGYAELLKRNLSGNSQLLNAANVIISESERMAEIVRKVGKITKYETKNYVGEAKILDLEKASGESEAKDFPR